MKRKIALALATLTLFSFGACNLTTGNSKPDNTQQNTQTGNDETFQGMYDEQYSRYDFMDWEIENGVLYDFENEGAEIMQKIRLTNFAGTITYSDDPQYVSSGKYSFKNEYDIDTSTGEKTVSYRFTVGNNGVDISKLSKITMDVWNVQNYEFTFKTTLTFGTFGYETEEQTVLANGKTTISATLDKETKDYLNIRPEFGLKNLSYITYTVTLPQDQEKVKTLYFDNIHYHADDTSYDASGGAEPFTRVTYSDKMGGVEVNNFNDFNRTLFTVPEYQWSNGVANLKAAASKYFKTEWSSEFKKEGGGALKITNHGWTEPTDAEFLEKYNHYNKFPRISFFGETMVGDMGFAKYNTFSFWVYYEKQEKTAGQNEPKSEIQIFLQLFKSIYTGAHVSSPGFWIPANEWVNIQVDFTQSLYLNRGTVQKFDLYTYGLSGNDPDQVIYIDDIRLSETYVKKAHLTGTWGNAKYAIYNEHGVAYKMTPKTNSKGQEIGATFAEI